MAKCPFFQLELGHTEQTIDWLTGDTKSVIKNIAPSNSFRKINDFGRSVWTYWYQIESNAQRMYLKMVGTEQENEAEILLTTF
ncbi:hypothetical protein BpHYR1_001657 [Brachionus plicatilis]|uniref:Uncharacterized protein n=1 Tax=Brachionus plicatilis TaxID=10195 RepID=A0A3M7SXR0_BRAPC|nr:hypothetical protein BpHYR1_001657 [Brachionus plicatilis]